jgi:EAL domain-containing protein (putative c-di-GMP-specific phosphodiesterase class I)/CheY-like chemotaxis protein
MNGRDLRFLVVNESVALLEAIERLVQSHRVEVALVSRGEELTRHLEAPIDLALIGVNSTCMNPIDVLRTLGTNQPGSRVMLVGDVHERLLQSMRLLADTLGVEVGASLGEAASVDELADALTAIVRERRAPSAAELRKALEEHQLLLHYQPKVSCKDGAHEVVAVEGFVRWTHPELGLLLPGRFLPMAEEAGLMSEVTDFTLMHGIEQAALWRGSGSDTVVALNLAPRLLKDAGFPDRLVSYLRQFELPANRLILEVTEASTLVDRNLCLDVFTRLRLAGIGLALDDFGTGFSSLTELYRMPFSEVKIDGSLIADVTRMREAATIVRAIIQLAHELSISVCAEGVESQTALEFLIGAGCDTVQGELICEPRAPHELEQFLRGSQPTAHSLQLRRKMKSSRGSP